MARGVPALAILFLIYFGLVPLGIVLDAFVAGVVGLGMSSGGYFAEVFRAGILAVHRGQREAAASVGMTPYTSFRWIVLPQAMRVILPPMVNMFVSLLKDTSLCSLISAPELMLRAKDLAMNVLPAHASLSAGGGRLFSCSPGRCRLSHAASKDACAGAIGQVGWTGRISSNWRFLPVHPRYIDAAQTRISPCIFRRPFAKTIARSCMR